MGYPEYQAYGADSGVVANEPSLSTDQMQRAEALLVASQALRGRTSGGSLFSKSDIVAPNSVDVYALASYIVTGNDPFSSEREIPQINLSDILGGIFENHAPERVEVDDAPFGVDENYTTEIKVKDND